MQFLFAVSELERIRQTEPFNHEEVALHSGSINLRPTFALDGNGDLMLPETNGFARTLEHNAIGIRIFF